jgi:hypothetical protein
MGKPAPTARARVLALGKRASRYSEAELARLVGVTRERIRQLKVHLPYKPTNRRQTHLAGYAYKVERAFYTAMRLGIDKLVALVDVRGEDECWPWLGHISNGYAVLNPGRRYVHRLIYEREHGPIPKGMLVVHKPGGRPCCNPRHLVLATERERTWRAFRGGSRVNVSDELRRLTPAQVRAIRRAYAKLPKFVVYRRGQRFERVPAGASKALARRFGMTDSKRLVHVATGRIGSWILPGKP